MTRNNQTFRQLVEGALKEEETRRRRNKTARLRELYDLVLDAKKHGFAHQVIVDILRKQGLEFHDVKTFEVTWYRIVREREKTHIDIQKIGSESVSLPVTSAQEPPSLPMRSRVPSAADGNSQNPLHDLGKPKNPGDWNPIPTATFEPGDE